MRHLYSNASQGRTVLGTFGVIGSILGFQFAASVIAGGAPPPLGDAAPGGVPQAPQRHARPDQLQDRVRHRGAAL